MSMYKLIRPLVFLLAPETAHRASLKFLSFADKVGLLGLMYQDRSTKAVNVMGIRFPNRIGLAAGLDKNGEFIDALGKLGFGHIEIGTVTPRPQPGNPTPRLFRLVESEGIINRMGFNNKGVDYLLEQVKRSSYTGVLGINIGKNFDTPVKKAVDDYVTGMQKVYPYADYITINISSPNTPGLRTLQYGEELRDLLTTLKSEQARLSENYQKYVPVAVKVAPDLGDSEIAKIAEILLEQKIDALIATNTTLSREGVEADPHASEQGGLSGKPLTTRSTLVIKKFADHLQGQIPIIGVGGVFSSKDASAKVAAGADLVQIYSGLIYQGISLIKEASQALDESVVATTQ